MACGDPTKFRFAIDRGGTFTDVYAECPGGKVKVLKLLSEDPTNYADAPREGIRRILQEEIQKPYPKSELVDASRIEWIRMGTTVATNALLERKGERVVLAITAGLRDLLHIGTQARPKIFDLEIAVPEVLYDRVIEVDERLVLTKDGAITGTTGETLSQERAVDLAKLEVELKAAYADGIRSVAVVLMHSYLHQDHEKQVEMLARQIGFEHVSLSSQVMRMAKIVPRGYTACADAYLTPCIQRYVESFSKGFINSLEGVGVLFMQSDGGLTPVAKYNGARAILSGPAGGVVGYATTAYSPKDGRAVIGFDMGGTSTDVSRFAGTYEHVFESTTAGVTIQAPQLDINTEAAGGGSCLKYRAGMFCVGPESAGASPGPTCYRKGGPLTVTDANLFLGRIQPKHFPSIFGETKDQPLDYAATRKAFVKLTVEVNNQSGGSATAIEIALGFIRVANEAMCRPIRALTQAKGYDTTSHILSCFGGAGGQHAVAIARSLGMTQIHVHRHSGILSAYGLAVADVVSEVNMPSATIFTPDNYQKLLREIQTFTEQGKKELTSQGFDSANLWVEAFLNMRYEGTDCAMMTPPTENTSIAISDMDSLPMANYMPTFRKMYLREFGFVIPSRAVIVDDIRIRITAKNKTTPRTSDVKQKAHATPLEIVAIYFDGYGKTDSPLYRVDDVPSTQTIQGPAVLLGGISTIVIEPHSSCTLSEHGDVTIILGDGIPKKITTALDAVHLSIFGHRFMSIAEQMGRALQRTSISVNIKERLDFSCAVFSPDGGLVANAPHIPVHLGAMQEAVKFQIQHLKGNINPGDVLLSNHPAAGGSHLPDITVMTPVFVGGRKEPTFFVASRGHHADIGGITPGSMPPNSTTLLDEGAAIISFKLVENDAFQEKGIAKLLTEPESGIGTRKLSDNMADLQAQVAANQRGIVLVNELIKECGLDVVLAYMGHIQENAESEVRRMLKEFAAIGNLDPETNLSVLQGSDFMDDGTEIRLKISINPTTGDAIFDFAGTGVQVMGNCNAPRAVTYSAIIYCLRCLVGFDLPLNQGCLVPVTILIPEGCLLYPDSTAAVVGGNVLTSQRVTDVILKAFNVCAASQGCMNNITFGNNNMGYYETVSGGAGAGPHWHGRSGVHTHMTNTRITDPEVLERRYPVVLDKFKLRDGSGGKGEFNGGDGVIRQFRFTEKLMLSVLTERRSHRPFGLNGGHDGMCGKNILIRRNNRQLNLGAKRSVAVDVGDRFLLLTPGGGGYGDPKKSQQKPTEKRFEQQQHNNDVQQEHEHEEDQYEDKDQDQSSDQSSDQDKDQDQDKGKGKDKDQVPVQDRPLKRLRTNATQWRKLMKAGGSLGKYSETQLGA